MRNDPGSFRDPAGYILHINNGIYRVVTNSGAAEFAAVKQSGVLENLVKQGLLVSYQEVDNSLVNINGYDGARYVLAHPRLDFISYPYEWPFSLLREAALTHLRVHMQVLDKGITLSDATAYNIQFAGSQPVFIDHLSFRRYIDGELWFGHRQFCDQFLNPLIMACVCGVPYHGWYRGNLEGISAVELDKILPWYSKLSPNIFLHVTSQAWLQKKYQSRKPASAVARKLPLSAYKNLLKQLFQWIESFKAPVSETSAWRDYTATATYQSEEMLAKKAFVTEYIQQSKPDVVWDMGCNTGEFSRVCLQSGARLVIGFDADPDVLDIAYEHAHRKKLAFLPLYMDLVNPSPPQGWRHAERAGLEGRNRPDGMLALALLHHLVISKNIPLAQAVDWLVDMAPGGVIEFVPKADPMVQKLLAYKKDIFPDYTEQNFMSLISRRATIVKEKILTRDGRKLYWYHRH